MSFGLGIEARIIEAPIQRAFRGSSCVRRTFWRASWRPLDGLRDSRGGTSAPARASSVQHAAMGTPIVRIRACHGAASARGLRHRDDHPSRCRRGGSRPSRASRCRKDSSSIAWGCPLPTTDPAAFFEGASPAPRGSPHAPHKGFGLSDRRAGQLPLGPRRRAYLPRGVRWRGWTSWSTPTAPGRSRNRGISRRPLAGRLCSRSSLRIRELVGALVDRDVRAT